jgi:hypothetical protein
MKRVLLAFVCLPGMAIAQNGGQSAESSSLRLERVGTTSDNKVIVKITNKQSCTADIKLKHNGQFRTKTVTALGWDTVQVTVPDFEIEAKPLTNCGNHMDMGWVELELCQALPVKFEWITATTLDKHTVRLQFKLEEVDGTELYVQLSTDGRLFKRVRIVTPDMKVNQIYTVIIKL